MIKRLLIILSIGLFVAVGCETLDTRVHTPPTVIVTECPKVKLKAPPKPLFINWKMMSFDGDEILYLHKNEAQKVLLERELFGKYIEDIFDRLRALDMLDKN